MDEKAVKRYADAVAADRCLAKIVEFPSKIEKLPKAEQLFLVPIDGYRVVHNLVKSPIQKGEACLYIMLDAVMPLDHKVLGCFQAKRLELRKIMGVVSEGLLFPLTDFPELKDCKVVIDVTTLLQIKKFVWPDEAYQYSDDSKSRALFPCRVPKTDEQRVQENPKMIEVLLGGVRFIITRKEDGCSVTFYFNNGTYLLCGRNNVWTKQESCNKHYFQIAEKHKMEEQLKKRNQNMAIQGEICGPRIGKNRLMLPHLVLRVFGIYDLAHHRYMPHDEMVQVCRDLGLETVPILFDGTWPDEKLTLANFVDFASTVTYTNPSNPSQTSRAEGIVVKSANDRRLLSFKLINHGY